jgi:hypothetical protein
LAMDRADSFAQPPVRTMSKAASIISCLDIFSFIGIDTFGVNNDCYL